MFVLDRIVGFSSRLRAVAMARRVPRVRWEKSWGNARVGWRRVARATRRILPHGRTRPASPAGFVVATPARARLLPRRRAQAHAHARVVHLARERLAVVEPRVARALKPAPGALRDEP